MKVDATVNITYDDLSDECKSRIEDLKRRGFHVVIKYPCDKLNYDPYIDDGIFKKAYPYPDIVLCDDKHNNTNVAQKAYGPDTVTYSSLKSGVAHAEI